MAKYSSTGDFLWARHLGGYGYEGLGRIALDGDDNVYFVTTYAYSEAHLDGNPIYDRSGQLVEAGTTYGTFLAKFDTNGGFEWVQQLDGDPAAVKGVRGYNIAVHHPEVTSEPPTVYIVGSFHGTVDFDPSGSTNTLSCLGESNDRDAFVAKYDGDGNYQWAQRAGNPVSDSTMTMDSANGVAVDAAGNAHVVGKFHGTADFGDTILTAKGPVWDAFVAKLDADDSAFAWARRMGGDSQEIDQERAWAVAVSASGEVYVGSRFYGTADFGSTTLVSQGGADGALSKLNDSGNFLWTKQFGAEDFDQLRGLALDDGGNVYAAGVFSYSIDFDPGAGNAILTANEGKTNVFVAKLDANGDFLSARRMGGQGPIADEARGIQVFGSDIYTTGAFGGVGDFDTGTETVVQTSSAWDVFVVKTTQDRGAIFGRLFVDSNEDGVFDANESPLAGRTVYLDQNQNGMLDASETSARTGAFGDYVFQHLLAGTPYYLAQQLPPGWTETVAPATATLTTGEFRTDQDFGTFAAADVSIYAQNSPRNLGDNRTVTSTLNVSDSHNILDLNVAINITHANVEDLSATLISPAGTRVALFYRVGGTGDNFTDTVFDDQAATPIGGGAAPFTGSFIPIWPLSVLANESVNGTWGLEIGDYTKGVRGTLNYWSLEVTHLAPGPVNTPPVAVDDAAITNEDTSVTIDKAALLSNDSDPDGDPVSIMSFGTPGNGSVVDNGNGTVTYTPNADFNGSDAFTYTISDGNGGTDSATVTVDVAAVNDPPVADAGGPYTVVEGGTVTLDASGSTDPDLPGDTLSYAWDFDYDGITFDLDATGQSPNFDATGLPLGQLTVGLQVTDSAGASDTTTAIVDVIAVPSEETHVGQSNVDLQDAHPKGSPRTTTLTLDISSALVIGTLDLDISIDGGSTNFSDLSAVLSNPYGHSQAIATLTSGIYSMSAFDGDPLAGTWTLEITDSVKKSRHVLTSWSLTATQLLESAPTSETASAADAALLAWFETDSSDDNDTDILTQALADDLALMLVE